ncbi:universal stress protein [Arthrobacter roseus]|uniref:universal stress protein n=1 Tax=Arthrobacter roseus TaxID=136274 RepID=UPI0019634B5E|nr:universal stress protein [Arthrobacter roseus]MBM7847521.1 nucleotide-binding universal stress UspA family protein [Arthrobacter roseus]
MNHTMDENVCPQARPEVAACRKELSEKSMPGVLSSSADAPILVGFDGSPASFAALEWAVDRAAELGCPVTLIRAVYESSMIPDAARYDTVINAARELLETGVRHACEIAPGVLLNTRVHSGDVVQALSDLSRNAQMVVLGMDKSNLGPGQVIGSVSHQVAIMSLSPVAVIPAQDNRTRAGVVAGVDGSAESLQAADFAAAEAQRTSQDLLILTSSAVPLKTDAAARTTLNQVVTTMTARYPDVAIQGVLETKDPPAEALLNAAASARLLVVGSRGRGALKRMTLGSVSHKALLNLTCPTIITRQRA